MAFSHQELLALQAGDKLKKYAMGRSVQLWLTPEGAKRWRYAFRFGEKQKVLALGTFPEVSKSEAMKRRDAAKHLLNQGIDPCAERKAAKAGHFETKDQFKAIAEEYLNQLAHKGRAQVTIDKNSWLLGLTYPHFGDVPITLIRAPDVLAVLRTLETRRRYETARRLRTTVGCVFRFAMATGRVEADPTLGLRGAIASPRPTPRAAITDPKEFARLLCVIDGYTGQPATRAALQLMALLFTRPGELRAAEWTEFDLEAALWTIPAARTKMRRPHRVPLSGQAMAVLAELNKGSNGSRFLFPSIRTVSKCLSENSLNAALRYLGYGPDQATAHGFRASASTMLNESGKWSADAIEKQLGHIEQNAIRRAYNRGEFWTERVALIQWWGSHLDQLKADFRDTKQQRSDLAAA